MSGRRYVVLFPGIGYTNDRPLLYYTGKMAVSEFGCELIRVSYHGIPNQVKGNPEKMHKAFQKALQTAEETLGDLDLLSCEDLVLVSKSIGTAVAGAWAKDRPCRNIYFTPLAETFSCIRPESGIAFHGTADPWADDASIISGCRRMNIPMTLVDNANHSLETGDVRKDIANLADVMEQVHEFLKKPSIEQALPPDFVSS